ncbi:hypothetical protein LINPERPRIM_LOCUS25990 [Linum perenne]
MSTLLAVKSIRTPKGILKYFKVTIVPLIIPTNFIVTEVGEFDAALLLGRPFLATRGILINVKGGILTVKVSYESITLSLQDGIKY